MGKVRCYFCRGDEHYSNECPYVVVKWITDAGLEVPSAKAILDRLRGDVYSEAERLLTKLLIAQYNAGYDQAY
jgi:hypothetical protein